MRGTLKTKAAPSSQMVQAYQHYAAPLRRSQWPNVKRSGNSCCLRKTSPESTCDETNLDLFLGLGLDSQVETTEFKTKDR